MAKEKIVFDFLHQKKYVPFLLLFCGAAAAFSMAPYYILPFMFVGLSYLVYQLFHIQSKRRAFFYGFCFGFAFGAVSMAWLSNALMIDGGTFAYLIPLVWIGMGLLFGLFYAIPAWLSVYAPDDWRRWCAFGGWFVVFEWVRSWLLTGFPWNLSGSIWNVSTEMLQSASIWGVYGLSLLTVLTFTTGAFLPRKKPIILAVLVLGLFYLGGLWRLYDTMPENVWGVKLRLVQPNIPQTLKWDRAKADEHYSKLIKMSAKDNEDITHVLWPESAVAFLVDKNEGERVRMMSAVRQGGTLITGGLRGANIDTWELGNSIFILDDLANIRGFYDKSHLVPFGEYMPMRDILPIDKIVPIGADFQSGSGVRTIHIPKAPPASPLVCYEIIFSGQVVQKKPRPSWIINVSNDAWYGLSAGPYQHFDMAVMRAVEEGLPVARATNNGISAVIDPYGRVPEMLDLGTEGVLDALLPRAIEATFYAKLGVLVPLFFALLCIGLSIHFNRRKGIK